MPPLEVGCRNHCPYCLFSIHVDINPGDRSSSCKGMMKPLSYHIRACKGIILTHRCLECGALKVNKAANEDSKQADSLDAIIGLTPSP